MPRPPLCLCAFLCCLLMPMALRAQIPTPQLVVEQIAGSPIAHAQVQDFGAVPRLTSRSLTFTLTNTGDAPLTLQQVFLPEPTVLTPAVFTLTQAPASPVAVGASTQFTITFRPTRVGLAYDSLRILSNGSPGNYSFTVTGTGEASEVSLDNASLDVNHGSTTALIKLNRTRTDLPATLSLRTLQQDYGLAPKFQGAVAGLDFVALTDTTVQFEVGEETRSIPIQLLPRAAMARKNLLFLVEIRNPGASTTIVNTLAQVRIRAEDSIKPTLILTTPAAGNVVGVSRYLVTGKAADASGLRSLVVRLNGGVAIDADLLEVLGITPVPFQAQIEPVDGPNVLEVTATDVCGNSTKITRSFTFTRRHELRVEMVDRYGYGIAHVGSLAITASPAASASAIFTPPYETFRRTSAVSAGTRIKIVATPNKDYAVYNWARGPEDAWPGRTDTYLPGSANVYEFEMPPWDTHVQVSFEPTPFLPPEGATNTLHWLLGPGSTLTPAADYFASLSGTITPAGSFTGKLLVQGRTIPVVARLNGTGPAIFTVGSSRLSYLKLPMGELVMSKLDGSTPQAVLRFPSDGDPQWVTGRWGKYSSSNKVTQYLLNPYKTQGYYTLHLSPTPASRPLPADRPYPRASGYAGLTITNLGQATLAGVLADGTTLTASTTLVDGLEGQAEVVAPVFAQLPTPGATTKTAVLTGDVGLNRYAPYVPNLSGDLRWLRPATTNPKVLLYPQGWPQGYDLHVHGTRYHSTYDLQTMLLLSGDPLPQGNAFLTFTGGGLTSSVSKGGLVFKKNTFVKLAPADASYTLAIAQATGLISGTFTPNWSLPVAARPVFKGIIVQNVQMHSSSAQGFFLNNAKTPPANGDASGAVILEPMPQPSAN